MPSRKSPERSAVNHSFPFVFKSRYYEERHGWNAHFKVDYDTHKNPLNFTKIKSTFAYLRSRKYIVKRVEVLETGRGHHLRVWTTATDIPAWTVLRIQRMFGDDPIRQRFNERRVRRREDGYNVLWNVKYRNGKIISQEVFSPDLTIQATRLIQ